MILQDYRLASTKALGNPLPLLAIQHHTSKLPVDGMIPPEPQRVLRDHLQLPTKDTVSFSVDAVRMARSDNVWSRFVNLGVNRKGCSVDRLVTDDNLTLFVHEDEVANGDLGEMH